VPDRGWPYGDTRIPAHPAGPAAGPAATGPAVAFLATAAARPVVVADLVAPPLSADGIRACAAELAGFADAALSGDHPRARVQFPPSYRARLLAAEGVPAWAGVNCRDRNRVALEGEIAACADAGAAGVHCVTGDHPATGHRPDAAPVFDLDSTGLVGIARSCGTLCSVAHAPTAPPAARRLPRLLAKIEAGAGVVFVDHCGGGQRLADAVAALRDAGFDGLVLCCVPVVTSADSAVMIAEIAAERMPAGYLAEITSAPDPVEAGIAAAARLAQSFLELPGVDGVNLSGGGGPGREVAASRTMAEVARRVLGAARQRGPRARRLPGGVR
jgi:5,10-methylenetetrahydrofolate reductase